MTADDLDDFRRYARQLWCVHCLCEVGGDAETLHGYCEKVIRYSAGMNPCPGCGKISEPMTDQQYADALGGALAGLLRDAVRYDNAAFLVMRPGPT